MDVRETLCLVDDREYNSADEWPEYTDIAWTTDEALREARDEEMDSWRHREDAEGGRLEARWIGDAFSGGFSGHE